jgi:site-specific DNA-methyltransferase (adenine-specific)
MSDRDASGGEGAEPSVGVVWAADVAAKDQEKEVSRAPPGTRYELIRADAVAWLRTLPDASVDLVVTDPPYESLEKHRAVGTTTRLSHSKSSSNDWFTVFPNARFPELFAEVHRVLKKNAHFYLYCDQETAFVAKPEGEKAGFRFWKPLVWDKISIGMGYHYRSRYELILFFEKGKRKLADLGVADLIREKRIHRGYPTEKPVAVSRVLIEQSSSPGELVIDPFMGTASAGVAAVSGGRAFAGADISEKALAIAEERLAATGAERAAIFDPTRVPIGQLALDIGSGD